MSFLSCTSSSPPSLPTCMLLENKIFYICTVLMSSQATHCSDDINSLVNIQCMSASVTDLHSVVSVLLFCPFAVSDAALDLLAGKQGSSVLGSMGADV